VREVANPTVAPATQQPANYPGIFVVVHGEGLTKAVGFAADSASAALLFHQLRKVYRGDAVSPLPHIAAPAGLTRIARLDHLVVAKQVSTESTGVCHAVNYCVINGKVQVGQ